MSLHRRPVGRARRLVVVAAVLMLAGCLLPWFTFVGDLPVEPFRAFDGSGILVFIAALAALALVALPYAAGEQPVGADRWVAYAILAVVALVGVLLWPLSVIDEPSGLLPDRAPGFWLAVLGSLILSRAAFDIAREPVRR